MNRSFGMVFLISFVFFPLVGCFHRQMIKSCSQAGLTYSREGRVCVDKDDIVLLQCVLNTSKRDSNRKTGVEASGNVGVEVGVKDIDIADGKVAVFSEKTLQDTSPELIKACKDYDRSSSNDGASTRELNFIKDEALAKVKRERERHLESCAKFYRAGASLEMKDFDEWYVFKTDKKGRVIETNHIDETTSNRERLELIKNKYSIKNSSEHDVIRSSCFNSVIGSMKFAPSMANSVGAMNVKYSVNNLEYRGNFYYNKSSKSKGKKSFYYKSKREKGHIHLLRKTLDQVLRQGFEPCFDKAGSSKTAFVNLTLTNNKEDGYEYKIQAYSLLSEEDEFTKCLEETLVKNKNIIRTERITKKMYQDKFIYIKSMEYGYLSKWEGVFPVPALRSNW